MARYRDLVDEVIEVSSAEAVAEMHRIASHHGMLVGPSSGAHWLAARPLLNLFFPELSGLVQPLSGEYAGRRRVLESVPFFTGYGVELGLLLAISEAYGLRAIAQVDLGMRVHRNQTLFDLSKMAFAIIQVALKHLGDRHRIHLLEEVNKTMKLIHYEDERYWIEQKEIEDQERPPMNSVPEYFLARHRAQPVPE